RRPRSPDDLPGGHRRRRRRRTPVRLHPPEAAATADPRPPGHGRPKCRVGTESLFASAGRTRPLATRPASGPSARERTYANHRGDFGTQQFRGRTTTHRAPILPGSAVSGARTSPSDQLALRRTDALGGSTRTGSGPGGGRLPGPPLPGEHRSPGRRREPSHLLNAPVLHPSTDRPTATVRSAASPTSIARRVEAARCPSAR